MKFVFICLGLVLAAPTSAADKAFSDVFERAQLGSINADVANSARFSPPETALIEALYSFGRFDTKAADAALKSYAALGDKDVERERQYYSLSESLHLVQADYARAAQDGAAWMALPNAEKQEDYQSMQQALGISRLLSGTAPVRTPDGIAPSVLPLLKDKVGLSRISISVDGRMQKAVVDTGASFSVLSSSTAKRLGLKPLDSAASLHSSVSNNISSRITVAKNVKVGSTRFENVVFLVLDDQQLTFPVPGGYSIPAILGFPELSRLGQLKFDAAHMQVGNLVTMGRPNLVLADGKLFVETEVAGSCVPLHLDTGANASELTGLYAKAHPEMLVALETRKRRLGGAGGVASDQVLGWAGAVMRVGDREVTLPDLDVSQSIQISDPLRYGTLGRDVLAQGYELDFVGMRLSIEGRPAPGNNACDKGGAVGAARVGS
jgi:predicted aspartyl protease